RYRRWVLGRRDGDGGHGHGLAAVRVVIVRAAVPRPRAELHAVRAGLGVAVYERGAVRARVFRRRVPPAELTLHRERRDQGGGLIAVQDPVTSDRGVGIGRARVERDGVTHNAVCRGGGERGQGRLV